MSKGIIIVLIILGLVVIAGAAFYLNQGSDIIQPSKTETEVVQAGNSEKAPEQGRLYKAEIKDFKLPDLTINVGDTIEWTNFDTAPHTATADNKFFDTDRLEKGDSQRIIFNKPGTFSYYCSIHPYMRGTVTVRE